MTQFEELNQHLKLVPIEPQGKKAFPASTETDFPVIGERVNLALASGEVVTVDAVQITSLNENDPQTRRIEWRVAESSSGNGRIIYRRRWEGNSEALALLSPCPQTAFLTEALA